MPLKDITNRILFVLAGNKYVYQIIFDGSYFVPYFTCNNLQQKKCRRPRCTACLYGMLSRIILLDDSQPRCLSKASTKVEQISEPQKLFDVFFHKKSNFFQPLLIFNKLQNEFF